MELEWIIYSYIVIFAISFQLTAGLSRDDKIVVVDRPEQTVYVAPISRNPDFASSAITFQPDLGIVDGPDRIRYDTTERKLYFTIGAQMAVGRSNVDGSDAEVFFTTSQSTRALALDEEAKKFYWSPGALMVTTSGIFCTDYEGTTTTDVITGLVDRNIFYNLALDKRKGFLYATVSRIGEESGIYRMNLDGTDFTQIALTINDPGALTLNSAGNRLYWGDDDEEVIQTIEIPEGFNRRPLYQFHEDDILTSEIALYYNNLYIVIGENYGWGDHLFRMPADGSSTPVTVGTVRTQQGFTSPESITFIYSPPCVTDTLVPTASSVSELSATWTPEPSPPNQCDADEYQVSYRPYDLGTCSVVTTDPAGTLDWQSTSTASLSSLSDNTYYQITLSSRNWPTDLQDAVSGNSVYAVEPCLGNLVLEKTPTNELSVTWSATSCECSASEYQVSYLATDYCNAQTSNTMSWQMQTEATLPISGAYSRVEVSVTPRKLFGVTQGTGRPSSASLDGITSVPTGPPTDVKMSDETSDSFVASWGNLACEHFGDETARYLYKLESQLGTITDETSMKTATFTNLRCGTQYMFSVAAVTADGVGPFSEPVNVETLISREPFASELTFTSTASATEISWSPSECPPSTFDVEYALILKDQCEVVPNPVPVSTGPVLGSPASLNNLEFYSTYTVNVIGIGSSGVSVKKSANITTKESIPNAEPLNVQLTEVQPSSLTFTWDSPVCTTRNGVIRYMYQLLRQSNVVGSQLTNDSTATLSSLTANTDYEFRVAAVTTAGTGPYSINIPAKTTDNTPQIVTGTITLDQKFIEDLQNPTSSSYIALKITVEQEIGRILQSTFLGTFQRIEGTAFRSGSVLVDYFATFAASNIEGAALADAVEDAIEEAVSSGSVSSLPIIAVSSQSVQCESGFCLNGGTCSNEASGTCSCVNGYSGTRCQMREPDPVPTSQPDSEKEIGPGAISAISASTAVGFIAAVIAIGVFVYQLRRRAKSADATTSGMALGLQAPPGLALNSLQYPQGDLLDNFYAIPNQFNGLANVNDYY